MAAVTPRRVASRVARASALVATCALAVAAAAGAAAPFARVSVSVPAHPSPTGDVHISFQPRGRLPRGGFYYAVLVLHDYPTAGAPPACATSSDMARTEYRSPDGARRLGLTILPARSTEGRWCAGGTYLGALYAVPHPPRCSYSSPCYGRTTQLAGPCFIVGEGHRVCGVVVNPSYSYPGGLPRPLDSSSRVIGRFTVRF